MYICSIRIRPKTRDNLKNVRPLIEESDEEVNTPLPEQPESPKKSPHKEPRKAVDGIGNDEIQNWLLSIVEAFNTEYKRRYEKGEISDKNPIIVKGTRDLLDGFVIGLAIRVSLEIFPFIR